MKVSQRKPLKMAALFLHCVGALQTGTFTNVFLVSAFDHHPDDLNKQLAALTL